MTINIKLINERRDEVRKVLETLNDNDIILSKYSNLHNFHKICKVYIECGIEQNGKIKLDDIKSFNYKLPIEKENNAIIEIL